MATTLRVEGTNCENCELTVEEALRRVEGVESAAVNRRTGVATVEGEADPLELVEAVREAGYEAET